MNWPHCLDRPLAEALDYVCRHAAHLLATSVRIAGSTAERPHDLQRLLEKAVVALGMRFDEIRSPTPHYKH